ncbi:hypothetical protein SteCoe_21038 [Stentor coeruleus]|uniref:CSD domain-containing protein n=1 Tax=Stentor coeruleus TaxID=5963 RepID=A0A1R2BQA0_9CILI|nr:hypothetical protein SteCoe_21038 [Stentor coeruleus]
MKRVKFHSLSSPNIMSLLNEKIPLSDLITISPGMSPSNYRIYNAPLDQLCNNTIHMLFANDISQLEHKLLGGNSPIDEFLPGNKSRFFRKAKSVCSRLKSKFVQSKNSIIAEDPEEANFIPEKIPIMELAQGIKIKEKVVILKKPPNKNRLQRGTFEGEKVTIKKYTGKIKTYNLRKRFGFIKADGDEKLEVFICEDDLVLSGINMKQFKDRISKKGLIQLRFNIKMHFIKEKKVNKAVEIEFIDAD